MKIVVDAYGSDNCPIEEVNGSILALKEIEDLEIVLVGKESELSQIIESNGYNKTRLTIIDATDKITCEDVPTEAIRKKADSSLVVALKALKEDEDATAIVSAGSTGAVLTGSILKIGRIKGVSRPALAPTLPTMKDGEVMLIDCGANVDCKPINLVHFALMGNTYMKQVYNINNPRIALLSNGTEDKKGNELTHTVFDILSKIEGLNFVGNMEARDILSGDYDVVVADGFYGNIALKSIECAVNCIFSSLKQEIKSSKKASLGALLMKGAFKQVKNKLDYNKKGGALFLGAQKIIIKAHGASGSEAIKNAIIQAYNASKLELNEKIKESIQNIDLSNLIKE